MIVGVDVGGTFTDLFLFDPARSAFRTAKLDSVQVPVDQRCDESTSTSGCEPEDFADFTAGNNARVQRGT